MTIIRPDSLPRFWWLYPWSMARQLHRNCNALRALCDRLDDVNKMQAADIVNLRIHIRVLDDAIVRGKAITPDAHPHE